MTELSTTDRKLGPKRQRASVPLSMRVRGIIETVAADRRLSIKEILGHKRTQGIAVARQISYYLARELTEASYPALAECFGGRDHSTIIHGYNVIERRMKQGREFAAMVEKLGLACN